MKPYKYIMCGTAFLFVACSMEQVKNAETVYSQPAIYPDYVGVTIPVNVAPLNFAMQSDSAVLIDAVFTGTVGGELHCQGKESTSIPADKWRALLAQNAGGSLFVQVSAKFAEGWRTYTPFGITVSTDSIDYGITYRLIEPGYEAYTKMGIYETALESGEERALFENTQVRGCVNCHSYNQGNPDYLSLHVRGEHGATLIQRPGAQLAAFNTKTPETLASCVYPYWHPSGRYIAYSTNNTRQGFHAGGKKIIEVLDLQSDMQVYDVETNTLLVPAALKGEGGYETFPAFSPCGQWLYYCCAQPESEQISAQELRYNLCRIAFDAATGTFGSVPEVVIDAAAMGKSVAYPRISYDGRYLCYSLADYGYFHIWHEEADLWLLDLATGEASAMTAANSTDAESVHSWSSNSRWLVFGSRRDDGQFTRPYFCHVGTDGTVGKAFMLPNANPKRFYDYRFMSYNIPEFVTKPVPLDAKKCEDILNASHRLPMQARVLE